MTSLWVLGVVVLGLVAIVALRRPQKTAPNNAPLMHKEAFGQEVFPNGKADHDAGANMVHEIMDGTMPLDECRDVFIEAALAFKAITAADKGTDITTHLRREWGDRLSADQRNAIAAYAAIRLLAMESRDELSIHMDPNGLIRYEGAVYDPRDQALHLNQDYLKNIPHSTTPIP